MALMASVYFDLFKNIYPKTIKSKLLEYNHCAPITSAPPKSGIKCTKRYNTLNKIVPVESVDVLLIDSIKIC